MIGNLYVEMLGDVPFGTGRPIATPNGGDCSATRSRLRKILLSYRLTNELGERQMMIGLIPIFCFLISMLYFLVTR